ncbi:MAG: alkaline phosphatase family protein [Ignavibacteria bacterium]|nr:alkaline phosphatase family protein [Ignavibacteria bacterium]
MSRKIIFWFTAVIAATSSVAAVAVNKQPKARLIVIVSFDQMRGDYPMRFKKFIGEGGFTRIQKEGTTFNKCFFEQANTITGPGHAAILTGTYAFANGIVGNDYCSARGGQCISCVNGGGSNVSAMQLEMPTLGMLLQQENPKSKVISISHKDRAAVMMGGDEKSSVLWLSDSLRLTTTNFYSRPAWLDVVNKKFSIKNYGGKTWSTEIPTELQPAADAAVGEGTFSNGKNIFPYKLSNSNNTEFLPDFLKSPFSVEWIFDVAMYALDAERLGRNRNVDLLCVGVSSTDYLGHTFGPDSREVQEMYLHCDKQMERLINKLDNTVGRNGYVLVVTSDHGASPVPEQLLSLSSFGNPALDAGRISKPALQHFVDSTLNAKFKTDSATIWVKNFYPPNLYFNHSTISTFSNLDSVTSITIEALRTRNGIGVITSKKEMLRGNCPPNTEAEVCQFIRNSFHPDRSGDVLLYTKRYWIFGKDPSSHGSPHDYDRWVPLMLFGGPIKPQTSDARVTPVNAAVTIADWFGINMGSVAGKPLPLKK